MVNIQSETELMLFDGRNLAQNGWFVVRSLLPSGKTGNRSAMVCETKRHTRLDKNARYRFLTRLVIIPTRKRWL